jgi:hypothetical protein
MWQEAIRIIQQEIIAQLSKDIEERLNQGQWWIRIVEAINYKNYESAQWWAKDWVFHPDWGTSVLKEISPTFREDKLGGEVSFANYLRQPVLRDASLFLRRNFHLYQSDLYGNTILHGLLPLDPRTGEFHFVYKGTSYRGRGSKTQASVWQGLDRLSHDIQDMNHSIDDLHEALSLINAWYADRTTVAKAVNVADAVNSVGSERMAAANGYSRLYMGHVPFYEFLTRLTPEQRGDRIQGFVVDNRLVLTDHGMGKRFGGRGAYVMSSPQDGLALNGFEQAKDKRIQSNPRTIELIEGDMEVVLSNNIGLHPMVYRNILLDELSQSAKQSRTTLKQ